jgi:hypothetical protein
MAAEMKEADVIVGLTFVSGAAVLTNHCVRVRVADRVTALVEAARALRLRGALELGLAAHEWLGNCCSTLAPAFERVSVEGTMAAVLEACEAAAPGSYFSEAVRSPLLLPLPLAQVLGGTVGDVADLTEVRCNGVFVLDDAALATVEEAGTVTLRFELRPPPSLGAWSAVHGLEFVRRGSLASGVGCAAAAAKLPSTRLSEALRRLGEAVYVEGAYAWVCFPCSDDEKARAEDEFRALEADSVLCWALEKLGAPAEVLAEAKTKRPRWDNAAALATLLALH